jgi:hypothetical protein
MNKSQRGGRGGRGGVSRGAADSNWRDTSARQTDQQRPPKQDSQAPRAPQANRAGGQPRLPAETKAPPQPFNVREVTDFLSSRYNSAHEDHKRATASANSGDKKKNGETPAVVLYQAEGGAWGPLSKPMAPGTDDFLSTLENALRVFERENSSAAA